MKIELTDNRKFYDFDYDLSQDELKKDDELMVQIPETINIKGRLEKLEDKIKVKFKLTGDLIYPCSRCLEEVRVKVDDYDFDEELELEDRTEIDLNEYVNDCLFINEPSFIVCQEDCKGLCPTCGINLNKETCNCHEEEDIDPRMQVLKQLL